MKKVKQGVLLREQQKYIGHIENMSYNNAYNKKGFQFHFQSN